MKKTVIIYGELKNGIQKRAIEELTGILFEYLSEYPVCIQYSENMDGDAFRCIYIGTKKNSLYIKKHSRIELSLPESYAISVREDTVMIEGYDDAGVLYGVLDFYNKYLVKYEREKIVRNSNENFSNPFERELLPEFEYISYPSIKERGLWTWGHVIYDYREYLHNMMKLKMNGIVIWNDFVPTNARDIVEYAHSCNIKVYWGFAWLWGTSFDGVSIKDLHGEPEKIFQKYEKEYAHVGGDGIYFQTFTELKSDNIDGILIAEAAANFVNETSALFYEKYPDIEIQFGLHATSVKNRLDFIRAVDKRLRIVWEDCGAFPFAYSPTRVENFEETKTFVGNIANLRGEDDKFGVVTKGLVNLDWSHFEHLRGSQYIGVGSRQFKEKYADLKARQWRYIQAGWLINSNKALEMIREIKILKKGDLSVFALVEDGVFEENIMYPVALYSEMLWDCEHDTDQLIQNVALRSYVTFA